MADWSILHNRMLRAAQRVKLSRLGRLAQRLSRRFDAVVAASLLQVIMFLERSSLRKRAPVSRLLAALRHTNVPPAPGTTCARPPADSPSVIVAQAADHPQAGLDATDLSPAAVRWISGGVRAGMLGLAALVLFSVWTRPPAVLTTQAAAQFTPTPGLAIINPANRAAAGESTPPAQPSIVTLERAVQEAMPQSESDDVPLVTMDTLADHELFADESAALAGRAAQPSAGDPRVVAAPIPAVGNTAAGDTEIVLIDPSLAADAAGEQEATPLAPFVNIVSTINFDFTPTPEPQPTAAASPTPTPAPIVLEPGRLWSNFLPGADGDHFWIGRPFPDFVRSQLASPNYQFGSTAGGRYRIHHGVDISNPQGTPVRAAVAGEVIHAGPDDPELLGPYNGFYGNAVVIRLDQTLPVAGGAMNVYLLYGHLSEVLAQSGQRVQPDDIVGRVGMTGIAIGPHLHVEVRLGVNDYAHSVNPYLWLTPTGKNGAVAVRLLTADGRTWPGARLTLARFENGKAVWARLIETYRDDETIGPDPMWGENGAMGSVPPGFYVLAGSVNGQRVRAELTVDAGRTTFVELRTP